MQPACLSRELVEGLLRGRLGFNGLVVTDQTKMMGYYGMSRFDALPLSIACGCDVILGINDVEEDVEAMKAGIRAGIVTEKRLTDALYRILACKAAIGLHKRKENGSFHPGKEALARIGCREHLETARKASQRAATLVKNTKGQIPLLPEVYKKIGVFVLAGNIGSLNSSYGQGVQSGGSDQITERIMSSLKKYGYEPELMVSSVDKGKIAEFKKRYDAVMIFADITSFAQTNSVRLLWPHPMSSCYPWYIHDVPTVFTSFNYTNHLIDVARVPAFINAYNDTPETVDETIKRIAGLAPFEGKYDEDVWCGMWDTHF